MKKKLLVVVYGISNSGKSTTLKALLKLLLQEKQAVKQKINIPATGDVGPLFVEFIDNKGQKINVGFSSAGDSEWIVDENLKFFDNLGCEIAFCAAKTYGVTVESIEKYIDRHPKVLLLPFYKVCKNDLGKGQQYAQYLAQEILCFTKLRWNKLIDGQECFSFD